MNMVCKLYLLWYNEYNWSVAREQWVNINARNMDRRTVHSWDSLREPTMAYEEKVKLFNIKRYLMPLPPLGTKNWTMRDYIRFIDQHGRWCPEGKDKWELYDKSSPNDLLTSLNQLQAIVPILRQHSGRIRCARGVGIVFSADDEWTVPWSGFQGACNVAVWFGF
jgi:hypothetical protein